MSNKLMPFNQDTLAAHNKYRSLHGVPTLRLSDDLMRTAQDWAEKLVMKPKLENSPISCKGDVGENISARTSTGSFVDLSGQEVSDQWYKDITHYDFDAGSGNAGNFTQLVWSGSSEVGFGKAHNNGKCIVVAHYRPPGNVRGRYKENVPRPMSAASIGQGSGDSPDVEAEAEPACEAAVSPPQEAGLCAAEEMSGDPTTEEAGLCAAEDMSGEPATEEADLCAAEDISGDPADEGGAPPRGNKTKTTVVTETVNEPNGKTYTVKREIEEFTDDFGNITERVKEIRLENPEAGAGAAGKVSSASSSEDEKEDKKKKKEKKKKDTKKPSEAKKKKRELNIFARDLIETHNAYRKKHGSGPLSRNKELDKMAQEWAESLVRSERLSNSNFTYKGNRLGENIASRWSNGPCDSAGKRIAGTQGHEVSDHWYSEEKKYDYETEPVNVQGIGNFTQLVWKNSKEIGIGKALNTDKDGTKVITVCLYHPAGNVLQCFKDNVMRP